jgi:hypothetical protein
MWSFVCGEKSERKREKINGRRLEKNKSNYAVL